MEVLDGPGEEGGDEDRSPCGYATNEMGGWPVFLFKLPKKRVPTCMTHIMFDAFEVSLRHANVQFEEGIKIDVANACVDTAPETAFLMKPP